MIGLCTDSNSQLPPELAQRYGVEVVPLTVVVDGVSYLEGVDLDADRFYRLFQKGTSPVSTASPSPGRFAGAYAALAQRGATEILSIHVDAATSATLESARLAGRSSPVPVRVVDSGTASFGVACCVWEAAEAVAKGAGLAEAEAEAVAVGARTDNVFVLGAPDLARRGGRLHCSAGARDGDAEGAPLPVFSFRQGRMVRVGQASSTEEANEVMADYIVASGSGLRVGVGMADAAATPLWRALEATLVERSEVLDLVRYRIGPSVGAHTGPGTVGAFAYPTAPPG